VLSGAGPALLAVVADDAQAVAEAMEAAIRRAQIAGRARALDVDGQGAVAHAIA
jgi:homoserine kinase